MHRRILVSGLAFFTAAAVAALVPLLASGRSTSVPRCTIVGTAGDDLLNGTEGNDVICGGPGDDVLDGGGGADIVRGGKGSDRMQGGAGKDVIRGGPGKDVIWAWDGRRDRVYGGPGYDRLPRRDLGLDVVSGIEAYG